ncbi:MAG: hypothetical protein U1E06_12860 [Tabrizicola sp.]|nr:hypothetical protein [Tabrizicola sp.]
MAPAAQAEMRDETHIISGKQVKIAVVGTIEIMTVGLDEEQIPVLSGADVAILGFPGDADSVALVGQPVLLVEVTGTHSCETGDARAYWAVTLDDPPMSDGPVTTCQALTPGAAPGMAVLEADPTGEAGEVWAWTPGKGWSGQAE